MLTVVNALHLPSWSFLFCNNNLLLQTIIILYSWRLSRPVSFFIRLSCTGRSGNGLEVKLLLDVSTATAADIFRRSQLQQESVADETSGTGFTSRLRPLRPECDNLINNYYFVKTNTHLFPTIRKLSLSS